MKATKLVETLQKLIEEYGLNIDVQTFSNQLGIYKEMDEINRIRLNN